MKHFSIHLKTFINITTAVLAGLCIFLVLSVVCLDKTVLSPDYNKYLFEKNNIYSKTTSMLQNSITDYINNLKKSNPESYQSHSQIFDMLEKSITPKMVKLNLDSIREGTFQYFKGEKIFLPDIYLSNQKDTEVATTQDALSKINKVSLSAILLYINRNDISDYLFIAKYFYFVISSLPAFLLLLVIFFSAVGIFFCKKLIEITKWVMLLLLSCGIASIIFGLCLLIYALTVIPKDIYPIVMSLPLEKEVIISYTYGLFVPLSVIMIIFGLLFFVLILLIKKLNSKFSTSINKYYINIESKNFKIQQKVRNLIFAAICIILIIATGYKLFVFKNEYDYNNFNLAVYKLKNANKVVQVIAAQDEAIYTLHVKLVNSLTDEVVVDTEINVKGKSELTGKSIDVTAKTDSKGIAKFTLDKGTFQVSFLPMHFPDTYKIPSPFFVDLKTPSSKLAEVRLDESTVNKDSHLWGVSEIELLDSNSIPIPDIELSISDNVKAPGSPDLAYSYTNSEGIAVFKLDQGTYKVNFVEAKFPAKFLLPSPIEITITPESVARYSLRLVNSN